jgi:hypothetical protein
MLKITLSQRNKIQLKLFPKRAATYYRKTASNSVNPAI